MTHISKRNFILQNIVRAIIALAGLLFAYILFSELVYKENPDYWIRQFYSNPTLIYLTYIGSELFFGIFPPEIFMIWALNKGSMEVYVLNVAFFAVVSYGAGYLTFLAGRYFSKVLYFRFLQRKFFTKHLPMVRKYGATLIIIAAMTPVPWATITLLLGTTNFKMKRFLLFALSRIFRFALYGYLVYNSSGFMN
jgi:membrane protein DedA with SNARE-associated domain